MHERGEINKAPVCDSGTGRAGTAWYVQESDRYIGRRSCTATFYAQEAEVGDRVPVLSPMAEICNTCNITLREDLGKGGQV